jgi:hypothetical protein
MERDCIDGKKTTTPEVGYPLSGVVVPLQD